MISCRIVTPTGQERTLETSIINVGTTDGQRGILPNHMPIVLMLTISKLSTVENGVVKNYAISSGMLYFRDNVATILVDSIESQDEIDVKRAEAAAERAKARLGADDPNLDLKRAELALSRAMNRINVASVK